MTAAETALSAHRASKQPLTLLVDDDPTVDAAFAGEEAAHLSETGLAPEEMWACTGADSLRLVVLSASRTAREIFRVLSLAERLVAPSGAILILPSSTGECRFEAVDAFAGVTEGWKQNLLEGNVIELRKSAPRAIASASPDVTPATARHPERVISLSVFGTANYWNYLPAFIRAHHAVFPGWQLRIHHDDEIDRVAYGPALRRLAEREIITLVHMPSRAGQGKCERMLYRLAPAWDETVEYVFARDLDALPTWRERCCAEEFIASGVDMSAIHDANAHAGIMGGLCAFRAEALRVFAPSFAQFIEDANFSDERWSQHGADQDYLNNRLGGKMTSLGHSLRIEGHNRNDAMGPIKYVTEIAPPSQEVVDSVLPIVREKSDSLIPYMGAAGYDLDAALRFYNRLTGPAVALIKAAEAG